MRPFGALSLVAVSLSGCAGHSFPLTNHFVFPSGAAAKAEVFADANGTLYPAGWQRHFQPVMSKKHPGRGRWLAGSLFAQAPPGSKFRALIDRDGTRQMSEINAFAARHKRIFILVHGYNASVNDVGSPYAAIEAQLDLKPGDGIIRFYWDGYAGSGVGAIKAWIKASNASQIVGSRSLREILNQIPGREIYLISHSRGASVVLSALGNPIYDPKFRSRTNQNARRWGARVMLSPKPLADNGNSIHVLMLAPAIDQIDFCAASEQPVKMKGFVCTNFRPLGSQVKSFGYTVNSGDPMLGKLFLSSRALVPTGMGYSPQIGLALKKAHYPFMQEYLFEKSAGFHAFLDYVAHPAFAQMLRDAGIARPVSPDGTFPEAAR